MAALLSPRIQKPSYLPRETQIRERGSDTSFISVVPGTPPCTFHLDSPLLTFRQIFALCPHIFPMETLLPHDQMHSASLKDLLQNNVQDQASSYTFIAPL